MLTVDSDRFNGIRDNRSIKGCERCFAFFPLILSACLSFCISSLYGSSRFLFEIGNSKYRFEYIIGARGKFKWIKSKYPFFIGINSPLNICPFDGFPFVGDIFLAIWVNNKYRFTVISTCIEHVEGTIETVERRRRVKYNLRTRMVQLVVLLTEQKISLRNPNTFLSTRGGTLKGASKLG